MYELDAVLAPSVVRFAESHVRSLLTWDILVFFHRNPDAVLDLDALASRLGRRAAELAPEVDKLVAAGILAFTAGLVRYEPTEGMREMVGGFAEACQDRSCRLALIALVLHEIGAH